MTSHPDPHIAAIFAEMEKYKPVTLLTLMGVDEGNGGLSSEALAGIQKDRTKEETVRNPHTSVPEPKALRKKRVLLFGGKAI